MNSVNIEIARAIKFVETRRNLLCKRYSIGLEVTALKINDIQTSWKMSWFGDKEEEMLKLEKLQHKLANKAIKEGLSTFTINELLDYMDIEELWWFVESGDSKEFIESFAPILDRVSKELHKRGFQFPDDH